MHASGRKILSIHRHAIRHYMFLSKSKSAFPLRLKSLEQPINVLNKQTNTPSSSRQKIGSYNEKHLKENVLGSD